MVAQALGDWGRHLIFDKQTMDDNNLELGVIWTLQKVIEYIIRLIQASERILLIEKGHALVL